VIIIGLIWYLYPNKENNKQQIVSMTPKVIAKEVVNDEIIEIQSSDKTKPLDFIYEDYQVEQDYLAQDNFNPNFCNLTQWQAYQKSALSEVIDSLDSDYQLYEVEVDKHLIISIYSANMTKYFEKQFKLLIKGVLGSYTQYLQIDLNNKIHMNMVISKNRQAYLSHAAIDGFNPSNSQGVYFGQRNLAFVSYYNEDQALKTAIHEAVHAINLHLFGITSRAFSEGTAEFFEEITLLNNNQYNVLISNKKLKAEPYLFSLIIQDDEWKNLDIPKLYYSSWAWLSFMMMEYEAKATMQRYLRKEQENLCSALSQETVLQLWQDNYIHFESDFGVWLDESYD